MNNIQPKKAILWMSKTGFSLYMEGNPSILTIPFFGESVQYFDIIDEAKLIQQIEDFILKNKIPALSLFFVIGQDSLIEREFTNDNKKEISQYLELIPYEIVYSKQLKKEKSILVAAFNGDFYRIFKNVFDKHRINIIALLPYFSISQTRLDSQNALSILRKAETVKSESMVAEEKHIESDYIPLVEKDNQEKSSLSYLIPVFIVLIIILVIVVISTQNQNKNIDSINTPTLTPVIIPTATNFPLSPEPAATDSAVKTATESAL